MNGAGGRPPLASGAFAQPSLAEARLSLIHIWILVMCGGRVTGIVDARTATKEQIGMLMMRTEGSGKP